MEPRRILIVSQFAPPSEFSAARRVAGLTKYLAHAGHKVTVLTSRLSGTGRVDGAERTIRTRDLLTTRLNWRRGRYGSLESGAEAYYDPSHSAVALAVVPDVPLLSWTPFATGAALSLGRFDWVLTTSPPESTHLVGLALQARGSGWVADLRDGWRFESTHPDWPSEWQHRADAALERLVAQRADLMVGVSDPITEDLRLRHGARAVTIPNGFDPDEYATLGGQSGIDLDERRVSLVHTGRMAFSGRSPGSLIEALRLLRAREPDVAERLEVVFAGPLSTEEAELLGAPDLVGMVRTVGTVPRETALRLQREADAALLITGRARRSEATAKLYEYIAARRPVLVLGEGTAAGEIVERHRAGWVTSASNTDRIASTLLEVVAGEGAVAGEDAAAEFSFETLAATLAREADEAVAARRRG